ncbi:hypothetical protein [Streptomyces cylindrosporus]|uniref:Uncharacterized protein n=1 Tax=Streptomyces cylindrosporus TaxID=2927583 RepID=A0ABS9YJV2_9ACTN|nr:hypothetical protein [Streptomyces cylindrosporus]MCI3277532.1 hypothetical protein [Streptomyces cylindrosporus]
MTITLTNTGAGVTHTDTITAVLPTPVANQLALFVVASGHTNDSIPSTPSGWTRAGTFSGGGGTFGSNAGPRRLTFFTRVLVGSDANPTTAIPTGSTGSVIAGRIFTFTRTAGTGWRWAVSFGEDTSSGTGFSAATSTALTFKAGDFTWISYSIGNGADSLTAEAITATGVAFGGVTERSDNAVATGNGLTVTSASCVVSTGSSTAQAPTVSATLATASVGVAGVLRLREASSDVNASPQSVFPPRNLVAVTGLEADDITSVTMYRQVGTTLTAVRAASAIDTTGVDALLRVDAEQPFGVSLNYAAQLTDVNGNTWTAYSGPITSTVTGDVISDAVRGTGAKVFIESWDDKKRTRDASVFNVGGRYVVVGRPRSAAQAQVTVSTDTDDDGDALQDVLDNATEGVILIRKQVTLAGVDGHLALLDDDERRTWTIPFRMWDLNTAETEPWPDALEAAGFTLQDIADNYTTLADLAADFATLLAIALFDFG